MRLILGWILILGCAGCRSVPTGGEVDREPLLPLPRMSSDSVALEIAFVDVPTDDAGWSDRLWQQVDEQHLTPEFRRNMQSNGFRCGIVGVQLPQELRQQLDRFQNASSRLLAEMAQGGKFRPKNRRLQLREGSQSEIVTSGLRDSLVVLIHEGDQVVGRTFQEAQTVFDLRAYPQGDGSATIHLTPHIQYGPPRQKWIGRDGMFQREVARKAQVFDDLTIKSNLLPGQTMMVTSFEMSRSLGGNFFRNAESDAVQKMLLIRLAQSQHDDLFDFEEVDESDSIVPSDIGSDGEALAPWELASRETESLPNDGPGQRRERQGFLQRPFGSRWKEKERTSSVSIERSDDGAVEEAAVRKESRGTSADGLTLDLD